MRFVRSPTELETLIEGIDGDGMVVRKVSARTRDVVYLKSLIEAHSGLASVLAERGPASRDRTTLFVATTPKMQRDLDDLLHELTGEVSLVVDGDG